MQYLGLDYLLLRLLLLYLCLVLYFIIEVLCLFAFKYLNVLRLLEEVSILLLLEYRFKLLLHRRDILIPIINLAEIGMCSLSERGLGKGRSCPPLQGGCGDLLIILARAYILVTFIIVLGAKAGAACDLNLTVYLLFLSLLGSD